MRIEKIAKSFDLGITWTAFPLHPETPQSGRRLADLFAGHPGYIEAMWPRLKAAGRSVGIDLPERTHTFNSRHAHEIAKWAEQQGCGPAFHRAIYTAYFHNGVNIALPSALEQIVAALGLNAATAEFVLTEGLFSEEVDRDWQRCREMGITAVPIIRHEDRQIVGFSTEEDLLALLARKRS